MSDGPATASASRTLIWGKSPESGGEGMDLTIGPGGKGLSASDARHELAIEAQCREDAHISKK